MKFTKNNKIAISIILVLVIVYVILYKNINAFVRRTVQGEVTDTNASFDTSKVLSKGDRGAGVVKLQRLIVAEDSNALPQYGSDGIFGQETEDALMNIRSVKQISIDEFNATSPNALTSTQPNLGNSVGNPDGYYNIGAANPDFQNATVLQA